MSWLRTISTFSPFSSEVESTLGWRLGVVLDLESLPLEFVDANARIAFLMPFARPPPKMLQKVGAMVLAIMRVIQSISAPATVINVAPLS